MLELPTLTFIIPGRSVLHLEVLTLYFSTLAPACSLTTLKETSHILRGPGGCVWNPDPYVHAVPTLLTSQASGQAHFGRPSRGRPW